MSHQMGIYAAKTLFRCRGIVFDKDGTLLDIWPMLRALALERHRQLSVRVRPDILDAVNAALGFDPRNGAIAPYGPLSSATRAEEVAITAGAICANGIPWHIANAIARDSFDEADRALDVTTGVVALSGVHETLASLSQAGFLIFVATADSHDRAERMLSHLGLKEYITGIVGADEVSRPKPDPEAVQVCAARAGLTPSDLVVVGDAPQDALMGRRSGAKAIGVLTGVATYDDLQGCCDEVLPSVAEIRPA